MFKEFLDFYNNCLFGISKIEPTFRGFFVVRRENRQFNKKKYNFLGRTSKIIVRSRRVLLHSECLVLPELLFPSQNDCSNFHFSAKLSGLKFIVGRSKKCSRGNCREGGGEAFSVNLLKNTNLRKSFLRWRQIRIVKRRHLYFLKYK